MNIVWKNSYLQSSEIGREANFIHFFSLFPPSYLQICLREHLGTDKFEKIFNENHETPFLLRAINILH